MTHVATEILRIAKVLIASSAEKEVEKLFKAILRGTPFAGKVFAVGGYVIII